MAYLIVIPYINSEAQGRELEYCIAGWHKHFKEDHLIVVVGDYPTEANELPLDVTFIPQPRVPETDTNNYRPHIDFVRKFKRVRSLFPKSDGFIYSCDDYYAVNDFTFDDVRVLKYIPGGVDFDPRSPNPFRRDKMKTKRVLESQGYPVRNFTTHLPQWFEWDKLERLWREYDMEHNSLVFEDLYYNTYYSVAPAIPIDGDDRYKCSVCSPNSDIERLRYDFSKKVWVNNSPTGFSATLDTLLREHYGL